jgi:hypothetical protein
MNPHLLAALGRERRRALDEDFARGDIFGNALRTLTARALRATGEALFRLGVALDDRVPVLLEDRAGALAEGEVQPQQWH